MTEGDTNVTNLVAEDVTVSDDLAATDDITAGGDITATGTVSGAAVAGDACMFGTSSATGAAAIQMDPTAEGEGLSTMIVDKTVSGLSAVETAVFSVPAGSVLRAVLGNVETAIGFAAGAGTSVTWSLGTTGDPDKYGTAGYPTAANALTQNSKSSWVATPTHLAAAEAIVVTIAATGGTADGDTAPNAGAVRVVLVYDTYAALANA